MKVSLTVLCCCIQEALSAHKALVQEQAVLGSKLENFKVTEEKGISFQINIYLYLNILFVNFHSPKVNNFVLKVFFIILINILQCR